MNSLTIANQIMAQYPDKCPIIISGNLRIEKDKFMVSRELSMYEFIYRIRSHIVIDRNHALFFLCNGTILPMNVTIGEAYTKYKSSDNILYIIICKESCFG